MRRGDVVTVAAGGGFGGKPRPSLIIQSDDFPDLGTLVVALFTSDLADAPLLRYRVLPTPENGLEKPSDLMVHLLVTARREQIGKRIGRIPDEQLAEVDRLLLAFLGLAG